MEYQQGEYTGETQEGVPHGSGRMVYKEDDHLNRGGSDLGQIIIKSSSLKDVCTRVSECE